MRNRILIEIDRLQDLVAELIDLVDTSHLWDLIEKYNTLIEAK